MQHKQLGSSHCLLLSLLNYFKVESFNQSVQGGKEKLHQLWVDWSKRQPKTGESTTSENGCEDQVMDYETCG